MRQRSRNMWPSTPAKRPSTMPGKTPSPKMSLVPLVVTNLVGKSPRVLWTTFKSPLFSSSLQQCLFMTHGTRDRPSATNDLTLHRHHFLFSYLCVVLSGLGFSAFIWRSSDVHGARGLTTAVRTVPRKGRAGLTQSLNRRACEPFTFQSCFALPCRGPMFHSPIHFCFHSSSAVVAHYHFSFSFHKW